MSEGSETMQSVLQDMVEAADADFFRRQHERLEKGKEKYGEFKFFTVDTLEEAMQECLDGANYFRFMYIKLYLLQQSVNKIKQEEPRIDRQGFISTAEMFGRHRD